MNLEARVTALEHKVDQPDHALHENNKILEATHGVVCLILNEQCEKFRKLEKELQDQKFQDQKKENNKRFNTFEELLIQIVNNLAGK
ncbi:hypothetical protein [Endozoicomonas euniceicola]|uniref:Uncharacterized protein n=1 Tax=Endozoicomonas euniceicola TaxID=1234143 RepID=A0ABY6GXH6_9GAMM|nr:hypothetical protein [Endozoicomonas euniceicola]UYM16738.1 hypothetical protein NX720_02045 [Endozoicomonas euniceicola]